MRITNSLTNQKEEFKPIHADQVNIYACGPTVYNYIHIGNARPLIVFDTLRRYLTFRGYNVKLVENFTDVDDKMINRANEEGTTVKELGDRFIKEYFKDAEALNVLPATVHPKATENMDAIISLVQKLVASGHAYVVDGDVYFDTKSFPDYGKLSGQNLEELELGARVEVDDRKKDPADFALWKAQKPGEPAWDSPWGKGRPGWHIECSAMSMKYLGDTLDIHGGGQDLKFPHHENEIAQSEAATGKPFANYWVHNGYVNMNGAKMAKSTGNFSTVRDVLKDYDGLVIRLFMLSTQYANPINFTQDALNQAKEALRRIDNCRENLAFIEAHPKDVQTDPKSLIDKLSESFNNAMDDDLNTAQAVGDIFEYIKSINTLFENGGSAQSAKEALRALDEHLNVLGLIRHGASEGIPDEVSVLVEERATARANKDWAKSDELRDKIKSLGYEIKDTPDGAKLSKMS